ncbi:MAG: collagen-like protein [Lachnospiraceae bacterium]|jgi:hypothetical protein|nr:collagen-like protein [Lachnospiraceae bacterium]
MTNGYQSIEFSGCTPIPVIGENGHWYVGDEDTGVIARGDCGEIGPVGPQGPQGEIGPVGLQGLQGVTGEKGDKGDPGAMGLQGIQGVAGPKGDKGDTGAMGPQGIQGIVGPMGPPGPQITTATNSDRLGGQPASYYAPKAVYSTNEVATGGTWINGKPIYRRVFKGTTSYVNGGAVALGNIANMDEVISMDGCILSAIASNVHTINCTPQVVVGISKTSKNVNVGVTDAVYFLGRPVTVIIEYTKL